MPSHPISCTCGQVQGEVSQTNQVTHAICYCRNCQDYAQALGRAGDILDSSGGTHIIMTTPSRVTFSTGKELLACTQVTANGPLRWYTTCCQTPIGNTPKAWTFPFVGLLATSLGSDPPALEQAFGPVQTLVFPTEATGPLPPEPRGKSAAMAAFGWRLFKARVSGSYRQTPFFRGDRGEPLVSPTPAGELLAATGVSLSDGR